MPKALNFATFFSTYLTQEVPENYQGEYRLDCPFHECENPTEHFYANCETGEWHCKRCDSAGNAKTLITMLHQQHYELTTLAQYLSLSEVRGLHPQTLEDAGFAYDADNDRWLVPYYTYNPEEGKWSPFLNNLGYFYPSSTNESTRFKIKKAGALSLYLYNPGIHSAPPSETAIICEGEWDTLAYYELHPDTTDLVLGKPGSGYNQAYMKTLSKSKTVHLLLDNDPAGHKQTVKAIEVIKNDISDIKILDWSLMEHAQKDVRDLWMMEGEKSLELITNALIPADVEAIDKDAIKLYQTSLSDYETVETFNDYTNTLSTYLYMTPETLAAMAAVLGITNSINIPGEPLWAFLIGPPSSGKTTFIDSFGGNNELFDNLSKISAKSLGDEPSYLAKLKDKTLFVKDFTVTLTDSIDSQKEVFGLLTDIFDGYVKIPYGNNQVREFYDLYFNMVAGVTDIVHSHSAASIGERFLRIDYLGKNYDSRMFARRALQNFGQARPQKELLTKNTLGFVNHLRSMPMIMTLQDEYLDPITDLAEFIATIRTKVESDPKEGVKYTPRPELPSRLANQLAKLFVSTRGVYNLDPNSDEQIDISSKTAFETVKKVALDTCYGFSLDIVRTIKKYPMSDRHTVAELAKIHPQRAYRVLGDLCTTGVLTKCSGRVGASGGRPAHYYAINPKLSNVLDYDCQESPKPSKPKHPTRGPRRKG
jgi:5S rRNA maturation endonuclease (ribonuclease M5)